MTEQKMVPSLRFREFDREWILLKIKDFVINEKGSMKIGPFGSQLKRDTFVDSGYKVFGQENIFLNDFIFGDRFISQEHFNRLKTNEIKEGDFVLSTMGTIGKCSIVPHLDKRGIMDSHMIRLRLSKNIVADFLSQSFSIFAIIKQIKRLSVGGIMDGLSMGIINELKFYIPAISEQQKIASFLTAVDEKIQLLTRKHELLQSYKKGIMQKIFSQEIRFKDDSGNDYPDWEEKKLSEVLFEHKDKSTGNEEVYSVSVHKGLINQIEHLGRSFSASNTDNYNLVKPHDIVYTKSPTGDFPYGIIKQARISNDVIISPLYGVFTPETPYLGYMLDIYFESKINVHNYLHSIIQKGAKNTINITNTTFLSKSLKLPIDKYEQKKIGKLLEIIDTKLESVSQQLEHIKTFKKGLLQQMFV